MDHKAHSELDVNANVKVVVMVGPDEYMGLVTRLEGVETLGSISEGYCVLGRTRTRRLMSLGAKEVE